ncbi:MAG: EamA family transporter RarD [Hyphomicrobiaceae bacterium]
MQNDDKRLSTGPAVAANDAEVRLGLLMALIAYVSWGFVTIFWRELAHVPVYETICHRSLWSVVLVGLYLAVQGRLGEVATVVADRRTLRILAVSAFFLFINWGGFVWAVSSGHVLEVSFGYFINPLMSVVLGLVVLGERLTGAQKVAIALALVAVGVELVLLGRFPVIALYLASTFALYGYIRKTLPARPTPAYLVESMMHLTVALPVLVYLETHGEGHFFLDLRTSALLVLTGPVTAIPLILFAGAARRLNLATLGLMQYFVPSIQFVLAFAYFGEELRPEKLVAFVIIWVALAILTVDAIRRERARKAAAVS